TVIATVTATDADGSAAITYSITGGAPLGLFEIDANGNVSLAAGQHLDFETTPSYILTVEASDGSAPVDTATVTITVTDIDEIAPDAPTIESVDDDVAPTTGPVTNGGKTNDTQPTIRLTFSTTGYTGAVAGDRVQLYNGASALGAAILLSATDITNGFIDITPSALGD